MVKSLIKVFIPIVLCFSLISSIVVSADVPTADDIYGNTIFQPDYRTGQLGDAIIGDFISDTIQDLLHDINDVIHGDGTNNKLYETLYNVSGDYINSITMPDLEYFCGKSDLVWYDDGLMSNKMHELVTVELYSAPQYKYDYLRWVDVSDNLAYPINCLVYTIYHYDGTISRYAVKRWNQTNPMYYRNFSLNDNNDYISISASGWQNDVYEITGYQTLELKSGWYRMDNEQRIYWHDTNDIEYPLANVPIEVIGASNGYPSDLDIISGYINWHPFQSSSWQATNIHFWCSYWYTNNTNAKNTADVSLTSDYQKNWYYNDTFVSNTTIDNSNANEIYDGCFATIINNDLGDTDITTLIPTIITELQPTLELGMGGLLDALMDFFGQMPDIGLTWDSDTTNNYYEIIPDDDQPPDVPTTTGDINIIVTVEVERPLVSSIVYDDDVDIGTFPVIETYTVPSYISETSGSMWALVGNVIGEGEYIPIVAFLSLIGIAIGVLLKGA